MGKVQKKIAFLVHLSSIGAAGVWEPGRAPGMPLALGQKSRISKPVHLQRGDKFHFSQAHLQLWLLVKEDFGVMLTPAKGQTAAPLMAK